MEIETEMEMETQIETEIEIETETEIETEQHLGGLQGDLHTHGATDGRQLASQSLLSLMGHVQDVLYGQIKLEGEQRRLKH